MRLHRVTVANLRHTEVSIDLVAPDGKPRPFAVLVGPNGCGKTTLLDAVHCAFEAVRNKNEPRFRVGLDPFDPSLRPARNDPWSATLAFSLAEGEVEAIEELEKLVSGSDRKLARKDLYEAQVTFNTDGTFGIAGDYRELRGRALTKVALARKLKVERFLERIGGVLYLDQARRGVLGDATTYADRALPDLPLRHVVGRLAMAAMVDSSWDASTRGTSPWTYAKALYARLAPPSTLVAAVPFDNGFDLELERPVSGGTVRYGMAGTSGGERQILKLVANLVHDRAYRSVVLIDEVELNLHPRWQRAMLRFCEEGPNENQFIVTTHSQEVRSLAVPSAVVEISPLDEAS